MVLNSTSEGKLKKVHPDLVRVVYRTAKLIKEKDFGFIITCGARTLEEQKKLLKAGATRTLTSRHIPGADGYSKAVDFAVTLSGKVRWDWPLYSKLLNLRTCLSNGVGTGRLLKMVLTFNYLKLNIHNL
jgi:peptidoglycan L-alanyl-D-glutamate endopeptidase CwlK